MQVDGCQRFGNAKAVGRSNPAIEAKPVTANAFTLARNAIAKAMQSAKIAVSGEPAFA